VAGLGLDVDVAARFNARGAGRRGVWPYVRLTVQALTAAPARTYTPTWMAPAAPRTPS
jgi:hypothetical protein